VSSYLDYPIYSSDVVCVLVLLFVFLCCSSCSCVVRRVLADVLGVLADVAMVSSPLIGRGYHSVSMVGNQSTG
jgi:hypothetical protein